MIDTKTIVCWLIHEFDIEQKQFILCRLRLNALKKLLSSSILSPLSHVILHAGLARSCRIHFFKKQRKTFSFGRRCVSGRKRSMRKCFCPVLTHHLRRSLLSRRARVIVWMMDSANSPFGSSQNDKVGVILRRLKVLGLKKTTKRKTGVMCISFGLLLCAMANDWY